MKEIKCYKENLLSFLSDFDPIKHKYHVFGDTVFYPLEIDSEGAKFDLAFQYGPLVKQEFSGILDNLYLVYGNEEIVKKDIETFYSTEKNIIRRYLTLPLADKMFDEDYFNFEWDMHVGQNFHEHRSDYYRDHFIHQVRNMYMMHQLLDSYFYDATMDALTDKHSSKIGEYVRLKLSQFMLDTGSKEYKLFEKIVESVSKNLGISNNPQSNQTFQNLTSIEKLTEFLNPYRKIYGLPEATISNYELTVNDYAFHYFYKYIIYASAYMCALFHDMGYPICHFLEVRGRLSDYNPTMYMITQNTAGSFDNISAKLNDSLLFTIVSHDEIRKRMQGEKGKHYDHGVYSAIAFLLHFYETGAIQKLSAEKQCAIEMAAVAIYNHTQKYACNLKPKDALKTNYYQPVFRQNPISFLLHFCDDLEEWDRRYFEISDASALSTCQSCLGTLMPHDPITKDKTPLPISFNHSSQYVEKWGEKNTKIDVFDCFCSQKEDSHKCFRRQVFQKRQIYLVTTASNVSFKISENKLIAHIDYDLYRLLKMSHINHTYARHRLKDIKELKGRLQNQNFKQQYQHFEFDDIKIECFMTSNPILIKIEILKSFMEQNIKDVSDNSTQNVLNDLQNWLRKKSNKKSNNYNEISKFLEFCAGTSDKTVPENHLYVYLTSGRPPRICFYTDLLNIVNEIQKNTAKGSNADQNIKTKITKFYTKWSVEDDDFYNETLKILIDDCLQHYDKAKKITKKIDSDLLYDAVLKYCHAENSFNKYYADTEGKYVGYFGDLFFFEMVNEARYFLEK